MTLISTKSRAPLRPHEVSWIIEGQIRPDQSAEGVRARALIKAHDLMDDDTAVAFIASLQPPFEGILCEALECADDRAHALNDFIRQYENREGRVIDWANLTVLGG